MAEESEEYLETGWNEQLRNVGRAWTTLFRLRAQVTTGRYNK
jgi:hypothetical protein